MGRNSVVTRRQFLKYMIGGAGLVAGVATGAIRSVKKQKPEECPYKPSLAEKVISKGEVGRYEGVTIVEDIWTFDKTDHLDALRYTVEAFKPKKLRKFSVVKSWSKV